ncbi:death-on-curing protein [Dulcicalothrix desertica PCC 7102]|uniref:Death-on-curing protein n=1 Tax=Dulcicalothrix desertica PCC 7102 TaxID=232991 RepID=A0A433VQP0_9CYAN|nr:type II toxin-antitoxin system death-on-curing family toxin [Dulcicalothrix desertica]RUT08355.1 death-on-curing protein [Dulcicalothrix desertica PCC 7102]TWH40221.1 death-on-curing protein [Dulcicalothrix desertica PCC 7102]
MNFPDKFDVIAVHAQLIAVTGGSQGLRDEGTLESALAAPLNRLYYEQASLIICAATYAFHLTQAHAFIDGNKRIAAAITETFLETNGAQLDMSNEEIVTLFLDIAAGRMSRDDIEILFLQKVFLKDE